MSLTKHGAIRLVLEEFGMRDLRSLSMVIKASSVPGHWNTDLVRFLRQAVALDIDRREKQMGKARLFQELGEVVNSRGCKQELRFVHFDPPLQDRYHYAVVSTKTIEHDGWNGARHGIMPYDPNGDVKFETSSGQNITTNETILSSEEVNVKESTWQDFLEDKGYLLHEGG